MEQKHNNLNELINADPQAREYFFELPQYVRDKIGTRADSVNTYSGLRDYAENLLRGDD